MIYWFTNCRELPKNVKPIQECCAFPTDIGRFWYIEFKNELIYGYLRDKNISWAYLARKYRYIVIPINPYQLQNTDPLMNDYCNVHIKPIIPTTDIGDIVGICKYLYNIGLALAGIASEQSLNLTDLRQQPFYSNS